MAESVKILGQSAPAATTETVLYTVPTATSAVVASVVVCNRGAEATFRIGVSENGGALGSADYLYYNVTLPATDTFVSTIGITLTADDEIRVYASTADLSFSAFGTEIT